MSKALFLILDRTLKKFLDLLLDLKPIQDLEKHQELINTHRIEIVFPLKWLCLDLQVKGPASGLERAVGPGVPVAGVTLHFQGQQRECFLLMSCGYTGRAFHGVTLPQGQLSS